MAVRQVDDLWSADAWPRSSSCTETSSRHGEPLLAGRRPLSGSRTHLQDEQTESDTGSVIIHQNFPSRPFAPLVDARGYAQPSTSSRFKPASTNSPKMSPAKSPVRSPATNVPATRSPIARSPAAKIPASSSRPSSQRGNLDAIPSLPLHHAARDQRVPRVHSTPAASGSPAASAHRASTTGGAARSLRVRTISPCKSEVDGYDLELAGESGEDLYGGSQEQMMHGKSQQPADAAVTRKQQAGKLWLRKRAAILGTTFGSPRPSKQERADRYGNEGQPLFPMSSSPIAPVQGFVRGSSLREHRGPLGPDEYENEWEEAIFGGEWIGGSWRTDSEDCRPAAVDDIAVVPSEGTSSGHAWEKSTDQSTRPFTSSPPRRTSFGARRKRQPKVDVSFRDSGDSSSSNSSKSFRACLTSSGRAERRQESDSDSAHPVLRSCSFLGCCSPPANSRPAAARKATRSPLDPSFLWDAREAAGVRVAAPEQDLIFPAPSEPAQLCGEGSERPSTAQARACDFPYPQSSPARSRKGYLDSQTTLRVSPTEEDLSETRKKVLGSRFGSPKRGDH